MLAETLTQVQSGRLDPEIHLPATSKLHLLDFIARELPRWRDHPDRPPNDGETRLTEHLCDHLNSATYYSSEWTHVQFRTETGDETKGNRTIDLTVKPRAAVLIVGGRRHCQHDSLFPIECKRLPTPTENGRDKREYVITESGTTGGIQRFKFGYHGAIHNFAAMIAYVQTQSFAQWLSALNGWISELSMNAGSIWSADDALDLVTYDSIARLQTLKSNHRRTGGLEQCELHHLWIGMN